VTTRHRRRYPRRRPDHRRTRRRIALAVVLLVGTGLFVRSLQNVGRVNLGIDTDRIVAASLDLEPAGFSAPAIEDFYRQLETRARALPEPGPLQLIRRHDLLDIDIAPPDLNVYEVNDHDPE